MQRKDDPFPTKKALLENFSKDETSLDAHHMTMIIAASTAHIIDKIGQAGKDCHPHCFVFYKKRDPMYGRYDTTVELSHFLIQLENNKKKSSASYPTFVSLL